MDTKTKSIGATRKTARKASNPTTKHSNIASLPSLINRGLAGSFCVSGEGYEDCTNQPHALADERAKRIGWFDAIMAAILINAAFMAVFAAKIAAFIDAVAQAQ